MKIASRCAAAVFIALALAACGSATEVGNPTGDVPRIVVGKIDASTIPDFSTGVIESRDASGLAAEPSQFSVVAVAEDGSDAESFVSEGWQFSLQLYVGETYSLELMRGLQTIGEFSFEQDDQGNRANRLHIAQAGPQIDLGLCSFEEGEVFPEYEPRGQAGVGGSDLGTGGDGGYGGEGGSGPGEPGYGSP